MIEQNLWINAKGRKKRIPPSTTGRTQILKEEKGDRADQDTSKLRATLSFWEKDKARRGMLWGYLTPLLPNHNRFVYYYK